MLSFISLLVLALAVSLDGFGVGVMYGLRKIAIPLSSVIIISCCSGAIVFLSMQFGVWLTAFLPPPAAKMAGSFILIAIGVWAIVQFALQKQEDDGHPPLNVLELCETDAEELKKTVLQIELKRLGLVIQILKTPAAADVDRSGVISASEAALLGIALSLDAFGAGFGAALIGYSPWIAAPMIMLASGSFIAAGLRVGFVFSGAKWMRRVAFLPACILILIGLYKML